MKNTSTILLIGAIALSVIGAAFALQPGRAAAGEAAPVLQNATPTAADTGAAQAPAVQGTPTEPQVQIWDQFCVKKIPYTLLAIPENATFEVIQPEGPLPTVRPGYSTTDIACESVGIFRGKQVLVCRGPDLWSFNVTISDGGASADFPVPLKSCPLPRP